MKIPKFYPALAHTDNTAYLDSNGKRKLMSIRRLIPNSMQKNFLISLSFDESIHYNTSDRDGDETGLEALGGHTLEPIQSIFVDCGAFHYSRDEIPKFKNGLFVTPTEALKQYKRRHLDRRNDVEYLLCSPDHIVFPDSNDEDAENRMELTIRCAEEFKLLTENLPNVTPVAVIHGRNQLERVAMAKRYIEMGYTYVAFGGLVPIASKTDEVLSQVAGIKDLRNPVIDPNSAIGLVREAGISIHMLGLNSIDWYHWWLRLQVDSFDGSKLSQEGAKMGQIWSFSNQSLLFGDFVNGKSMYDKHPIKKLRPIGWDDSEISRLIFDDRSKHPPEITKGIGVYFQNSRCTSSNCFDKHNVIRAPLKHVQDPRVSGSIDHNMARTVINFYVFEKMMEKMNSLFSERMESEEFPSWTMVRVGT